MYVILITCDIHFMTTITKIISKYRFMFKSLVKSDAFCDDIIQNTILIYEGELFY